MHLKELFEAIDAKPFRPFTIEIVSGRKIEVTHPDNIFVLPSRQAVDHIEVYHLPNWTYALVYPEGIVAILFNGRSRKRR